MYNTFPWLQIQSKGRGICFKCCRCLALSQLLNINLKCQFVPTHCPPAVSVLSLSAVPQPFEPVRCTEMILCLFIVPWASRRHPDFSMVRDNCPQQVYPNLWLPASGPRPSPLCLRLTRRDYGVQCHHLRWYFKGASKSTKKPCLCTERLSPPFKCKAWGPRCVASSGSIRSTLDISPSLCLPSINC